MGELYHGKRIYRDTNSGQEVVCPVSFLWEDIMDIEGSKNQPLPFKNTAAKVYVRLCGNRGMWLIERISVFRRRWNSYITGELDPKDLTTQPPSDN